MARKDIIRQDGTINYDAIGGFKERMDGHDVALAAKANQSDLNVATASLAEIVSLVPLPNGVDDTSAIQAILNAPYRSKIVRIPDGTYMINAVNTSGLNDKPNGGLNIPSNTIVELSPNTVLQTLANNSQTYSIFRVQDASNVIIRGGTLKGDRSTHTIAPAWQPNTTYSVNQQVNANGFVLQCATAGTSGTTSPKGTGNGITDGTVTWNYVYSGEWGYGICLNGVNNVSIEDMTIQDFWGDGIFLNEGMASFSPPCQNVKIKGVVSTNNRRQGMSIQYADGVYVYGSRFSTSNGTLPQSGVDIEPGISRYATKNIRFVGCSLLSNSGDGLSTALYVSQVIVDGCTLNGNTNRGVSLYGCNNGTFANNVVQGNGQNGIELNTATDNSIVGNTSLGNLNGIALNTNATRNTIVSNTLTGNTQHGVFVNGTSNNTISVNVCENNTLDGIRLSSANYNLVSKNNCYNNQQGGIHLVSSSVYNQLNGNYCRQNKWNGIKLEQTSDLNDILGNTCIENNQSGATNYNMHVFQCSHNNIQNNNCKMGGTQQPLTIGINIENSSSTGNLVSNNNCYLGGGNFGIANSGTGTLFGAGNWNKDGTFSTTPN